MATTLEQQIEAARLRLEELNKQKVTRAGQDELIKPSYDIAYKTIESPELKKRIAETTTSLTAAPADLRARYQNVYNPADQERLVSAGLSQIENKLALLANLKKDREARATDAGEFALAKYRAGTDKLTAESTVAKDEYDRLMAQKKEQESDADKKRELAKWQYGQGLPTNYEDLGLDAVGNRVGGSLSWRNNNPGNIKFGDFAKKYGAVQGAKAQDGGYFAVFPDLATGEKAQRELLRSKNYANLDLNAAMQRWSGNGYTYDKLVGLGAPAISKPLSRFSDTEMQALQTAMRTAEGWTTGQEINQSGLEISDADKRIIAAYPELESLDKTTQNKILSRVPAGKLEKFLSDYNGVLAKARQQGVPSLDIAQFLEDWIANELEEEAIAAKKNQFNISVGDVSAAKSNAY